jgi:FAD/FMN-containing dehydrogenase
LREPRRISRRTALSALASGLVALPHLPAAAQRAADSARVLGDASGLTGIRVARSLTIPSRDSDKLIAELRAMLREAAAENRAVAIGGARHSMGGQSIPRDGIAATLSEPALNADRPRKFYSATAGMRWRDILRHLETTDLSVKVMQSNSDFSVGGTLSVNAHGWPCPFGPFVSTVRSFRLLLADGTLLNCSRTENADLFGLVAGGYGLLGIVVDAEMDAVENDLLLPRYETIDASAIAPAFVDAATQAGTSMAYGRLSVARDGFLSQGLVVSYRSAGASQPLPPIRRSTAYSFLSRRLFRAQIGSESGKKARWYAETILLPKAAANHALTRNTILSYPVSVLAETSRQRTDILHEYFLPADRFAEFLAACREIITPAHDLLNVTLRYVAADRDSVLAFAPQPRVAAVMLFSQERSARADENARAMTQNLIDAALKLGGSYYLPYRLHARPDQFRSAYPRAAEFAARKRHYDPQLRFRNSLWDTYFA